MSFLEPGENFFHYTTREAAFAHILPNCRLRLSRYRDMRDPLEYKKWLLTGSFLDVETEKAGSLLEKFTDELDTKRAEARLLSLSIDAPTGSTNEPFYRGWSRGRMWEQYAENHSGACLVFDRSALAEAMVEAFGEPQAGSVYSQEVRYEEPPAPGLQVDLDRLAQGDGPAPVDEFVARHHRELFFTKTGDWQAEYEYRFVALPKEGLASSVDFGNALRAVILGERFPEWQISAAQQACAPHGAFLARMWWQQGIPTPLPVLSPES